MGDGARPKSDHGVDQFGRKDCNVWCGSGQYNAEAQLWENYSHVPGCQAEARDTPGREINWSTVVLRWSLLVADFHHLLHIDLDSVFHRRTWRWFESRVCAMLAYPDSLLGASIDRDKAGAPVEQAPTGPPDMTADNMEGITL